MPDQFITDIFDHPIETDGILGDALAGSEDATPSQEPDRAESTPVANSPTPDVSS